MTIEFRNVSFHYQPDRDILDNLSFSVETPGLFLIIGQNGVGKSTLLKLLNGILKPSKGEVLVDGLDTRGESISKLSKLICITFQNPADQIFAPSVRREVEFGPLNLRRANVAELVEESLTMCRLEPFAQSHPYDLPPAQRKLLTLASALASGAPFLAFDEPSAGLSQIERLIFENILTAMRRDRRGLIVVSHDLGLFLRYATSVLVLAEGRQVYQGEAKNLMEQETQLRRAGLRLPLPIRLRKILEG